MAKFVYVKPYSGSKTTAVNIDNVLWLESIPEKPGEEKAHIILHLINGEPLKIENKIDDRTMSQFFEM